MSQSADRERRITFKEISDDVRRVSSTVKLIISTSNRRSLTGTSIGHKNSHSSISSFSRTSIKHSPSDTLSIHGSLGHTQNGIEVKTSSSTNQVGEVRSSSLGHRRSRSRSRTVIDTRRSGSFKEQKPVLLGDISMIAKFRSKAKFKLLIARNMLRQRNKVARIALKNRMLELDDGEDFISDIVEEVVSGTLNIIYDKYIERQLLPYTISQAKEALLTIIDWRFLASDPGEVDPSIDPTWQEDEEPTAAIPDCWAQGSVPKTIVKTRAASVLLLTEERASIVNEPIAEEEEACNEIKLDEEAKPWEITDEQLLSDDMPSVKITEEVQAAQKKKESYGVQVPPVGTEIPPPVPVPAPPPGSKTRKGRTKFRAKKGRLQSAGLRNMTESLDETERRITTEERMRTGPAEQQTTDKSTKLGTMPKSVGSILKSSQKTSVSTTKEFQAGRPPGSRDVYYDEQGNVIAMSKINPEKLPTHRIKTKFYVIDPAVEAAQARLDAMRTGRYTASKPKKGPLPISDKTKLDKTSVLDYRSVNSHVITHTRSKIGTKGDISATPLPPPMIESMELAPGAIVREGDRVKRGPKQLRRTADKLPKSDSLRPVGVEPDMTISVQELLGNKGPRVRIEPTPVPPIIGKHDMNSMQKVVTS